MNKADGFISLHRKILNWEWYQNPNTFRLFVHCLLMANFTDGKFEGREIKRGQFVTSLDHLSAETRLSVRQVRVALDHLILTGELTSESNNRYRVITVVKYDQYQMNGNQNGNQMTDKGQANDNQVTGKRQQYNKNNKKNKEIKKQYIESEGSAKRFSPPTAEEVSAYLDELGPKAASIDPERFVDYYATRGWELKAGQKIKDWKACVRTWIKKSEVHPEKPYPAQQKKILPAQDFEQRDYTNVQKEIEERQRNHIIEMICRNNGLWDEANNKPVDGWREKMDQLKAEGRAV